MRKWRPAGGGLRRGVHAAHRRHDHDRGAAGHGAPAEHHLQRPAWVIDLYALLLGALVLTVGAVADRLGRRRIYLTGLVLFAGSSLACGLAPNVGALIAARGVQGIGAAAMFATTMALISNMYSGATAA
jgi:MFS family permease